MVNFFRLSKYFLAYIVILIITAAIAVGGLLHPIDLEVYKKFYLNSQIEKSNSLIKDKIIFVDIPVNDNYGNFLGVEILRGQVANLLENISEMNYSVLEPPVVILDMTFSNNPIALDSIKNAIEKLINEKGIKVYASYELPPKGDHPSFQSHDALQAQVLYKTVTGGRLNTKFNTHGKGILSYDSFELIGNTPIPSLPVKVINDYSKREKMDLRDTINYPLPLRLPFDQKNFRDNSYEFIADSIVTLSRKFSKNNTSINLSDKFIIVGLNDDIQNIDGNNVPGPYLVGAAIIDQFKGNEFTRPSHDNIVIQLAMVLAFALFVCVIFALVYKYVRILQTKPYIIAIFSFILGLLLLIGFGYAFLNYTIIRPALPILSMLWAAVLAWHFTKKFLVTGIMEGGEIYDVFISYSHGDSIWVKQNLYNPLNEFKKPDGSKLNIFFDEKSIGIGEAFTIKYMKAIVDSKLFVSVMSKEYYSKNHCRNEMDLAVKRSIENLIKLFPIAFSFDCIPEHYNHIIAGESVDKTNFMAKLTNVIMKKEKDQLNEQDALEEQELIQQKQKQPDKQDITKPMELDHQEPKPTDKSDSIEAVNLGQQEAEPSEKDEIEIFDNLDSDKKDKKAKKKNKKSDKKEKKETNKKKEKKKSKKEEKEKAKKKVKKAEKKSDKKNKKDKKEKEKKTKKSSEKKDKKVKDKKTKKSSDKKSKKPKSKKGKKS